VASEVDKLIVSIEARTADLQKDLKKASGKVEQFSTKAKGQLSSISKAVGPLGAALASAFSVRAIVNFTMEVVALGDSIGKTADKIGITTDLLQELRFAADRQGVSTGELDKAMEQFIKRVGEVNYGMRDAQMAFEALGIEVEDENGKIKDAERLFYEVADGIDSMENHTDKAATAAKLFGRAGIGMVNVLRGGAGGVRELGTQLRELGGLIDNESVRQAEDLTDAFYNLSAEWDGLTHNTLLKFSPALFGFITGLHTLLELVTTRRPFAGGMLGLFAGVATFWQEYVELVERGLPAQDDQNDSLNTTAEDLAVLNEQLQLYLEMRRQGLADLAREGDTAFDIPEMKPAPQGVPPEALADQLTTELFLENVARKERAFDSFTTSAQAGYNQFWGSLANMDMTGAERFKAIQNAMLQAGLRMIGDLLLATISADQAKIASGAAVAVAAVANTAIEIGSKLASAAASIAGAVADMIRWLVAAMGPFGLGVAVGAVGGLLGMWAGFKKQLGFAKGGILPKGQAGFFEGYGNEVVAPQKDFMRVMAALTGMREHDLRTGTGGGGGSMTFNINTLDPRALPQIIRQDVIPVLNRERKRGRQW
jgi:hypothetical protein